MYMLFYVLSIIWIWQTYLTNPTTIWHISFFILFVISSTFLLSYVGPDKEILEINDYHLSIKWYYLFKKSKVNNVTLIKRKRKIENDIPLEDIKMITVRKYPTQLPYSKPYLTIIVTTVDDIMVEAVYGYKFEEMKSFIREVARRINRDTTKIMIPKDVLHLFHHQPPEPSLGHPASPMARG